MLLASFDAVLSDLDGVVYAGAEAIRGAPEALQRVLDHGAALGYITNNASRSPAAVAEHLRELGAPATEETVFGSADAGASLLGKHLESGNRVLVVGGDYLRECVARAGFVAVESHTDEPDGVIQGFHPDLGWTHLAEASYAIARGAVWVATNTDLTIPRAEGIAPGNGALVHAVSLPSGAQPHVAGKPEPYLFEHAARELGVSAPLVVGDRLDTDILGGNRAGFATAFVATGIDSYESVIAAVPEERPRYLLAHLDQLFEPMPDVELSEDPAGTAVCGDATASADGDVVVLSEDSVDAWRAACALWWSTHPGQATPTITVSA
ncbi:HAD hydrolase-like protein [Zhihengliuella somnathii]